MTIGAFFIFLGAKQGFAHIWGLTNNDVIGCDRTKFLEIYSSGKLAQIKVRKSRKSPGPRENGFEDMKISIEV